jgi:hypothetical protein
MLLLQLLLLLMLLLLLLLLLLSTKVQMKEASSTSHIKLEIKSAAPFAYCLCTHLTPTLSSTDYP